MGKKPESVGRGEHSKGGPQHPNTPKRTPSEIDSTRAQISKLYLKGISQYEIASQLRISRDMVRYDLEAIKTEWRKEAVFNYDAAKDKELQKIDNLESTYWDAWDRSVKTKGEKTKQQMLRANGKTPEVRTAVERIETFGDPRFLAGISWCIDRRIKLLGLDALPPTLPGEGAVAVQPGQMGVIYLPSFSTPRTPPMQAAKN